MDFQRILQYLAKLEQNNNRAFFHETHAEYDAAKADFLALTEAMKFTIAENCEPLADQLLVTAAKDMIYRIPRDARVYRNAPPYNPAMRAYISPNRKGLWPLGYYVLIQPGDRSLIAVGAFTSERTQLDYMREYIAARGYQLEELLLKSGLELQGDKLKKTPRGYDEEFIFADFMKYKNWQVIRNIKDKELTGEKSFLRLLKKEIERMEPFRAFMDEGLRNMGGRNQW